MEDETLEQIEKSDDLTEQEKEFVIRALAGAVSLQGNYENLVPTMNLIENIIRKLSKGVAP